MKRFTSTLLLVLASVTGAFAQAMTPKDSRFLSEAMQTSLLEIKLSELCVTNATAESVKRLGEQVIVEHTKTNTELKELATKKNVSLQSALNSDNLKIYNELASKTGSSFDHAYTELMAKEHQKTVAMYKEENNSGSDDDVKNWASRTLPVLEHHLMMANEVVATLK